MHGMILRNKAGQILNLLESLIYLIVDSKIILLIACASKMTAVYLMDGTFVNTFFCIYYFINWIRRVYLLVRHEHPVSK